MSVFSDWQYRWFGTFREQGAEFAVCPSVLNFVDNAWDTRTRERAVAYLAGAPVVAACPGPTLCLFAGRDCDHGKGGILQHAHTDGTWVWDDSLIHYVEWHGVRVPDWFVAHMAAQEFIPPAEFAPGELTDRILDSLPHPPLLHVELSAPPPSGDPS